ncbi:MAG: hypothetical protein LBV13_01240 [Methanomassiliicoccaceae archaeon]|jgi:hypothetical protein|nr:hypothetical protein [Methanomassiliicoccaceae archaeon]
MTRFDFVKRYLASTAFDDEPASTKYHGAHPGGLLRHSRNVVKNLNILTKQLDLEWSSGESINIIGWTHDICKIGAYIKTEEGYRWNPEHPKEHGLLSAEMIKRITQLTEEEEYCIRWHMGPYTQDAGTTSEAWKGFDAAIKKYPNVFWTHVADMMATKFDEKGG